MPEIEKNDEEKIDTSNIFDQFEVDEETRKEIEEIAINKDSIYYLKKTGTFLRYVNYLLIFFILF